MINNALNNVTIGIDVVDIVRFNKLSNNRNFVNKVFTENEKKNLIEKSNKSESMAGLFAVKEAIKKTITESIEFNEIEINYKKNGAPLVEYLNKSISKKYYSKISISHTSKIAEAICITIKLTK